MNLDLTSLFPDLEALTPDGRWNMLQDWLAKNPEYGENIDRWSQMPVDQVCDEITIQIVGKYGGLAAFVLQTEVGRAVKQQLRRSVELLQACYRERQAYDNQPLEKEIKNVRKRIARNKQAAGDRD